jgi:hypothetical protein
MDYQLENQNLSLNERNKKFFSDFSCDKQEITETEVDDTFKKYSGFMLEKEGLIQILNDLIEFAKAKCVSKTTGLKNILDAIDYKNRVIMIV